MFIKHLCAVKWKHPFQYFSNSVTIYQARFSCTFMPHTMQKLQRLFAFSSDISEVLSYCSAQTHGLYYSNRNDSV